jgi:predicted ester cyclase
MSAANEELVKKWYNELFNRGNLAVADAIIADIADIQGEVKGFPRGPGGYKQLVTLYKNALPDAQITIDTIKSDGDNTVTVDWTGQGTFTHDFMGHPPTGNQVTIKGRDIWHIQSGKIIGNECKTEHKPF